jgi:hypothetical protein
LLGQSAAIERSNGKRGLIAFDSMSVCGKAGVVEGEKKTNAHHV